MCKGGASESGLAALRGGGEQSSGGDHTKCHETTSSPKHMDCDAAGGSDGRVSVVPDSASLIGIEDDLPTVDEFEKELSRCSWAALSEMHKVITGWRVRLDRESWLQASTRLRSSDLGLVFRKDPFTRHSAQRPRGYAGDAGLLDLIYSPTLCPAQVCEVGAAIWSFTINTPEPVAVRERLGLLSAAIGDVAERCDVPRVLAVACGHLREADRVPAVAEGVFARPGARFVALDQDELSLGEVSGRLGGHGVETLRANVLDLLKGDGPGDGFDLIYAAGLYDYLEDRVARLLTAKLFDRLAPGGRLLIGNFTPASPSTGYMESFMDWHLIYRDEAAVSALAERVRRSDIASQRVYSGANRCIAYLDMVRA